MYQNILVPLDGSSASEHAIPWALSAAKRDEAALRLVRVHLTPNTVMIGTEPIADLSLDSALRDQETAYIDEKVRQVKAVTKCEVTGELLEGSVVDALIESSSTRPTDLVVMTTHGRGALARFWLGSVADNFIRHTTIPTLLIRPLDDAPDLSVIPHIRHILIPLDGSPLAKQILEPATRLGQMEGADYTLIMVLDAVEDVVGLAGKPALELPPPWNTEYIHAKADSYLREVADTLRLRAMRVNTELILHGSAPKAILDYAAGHDHPVIAMATRGRAGLSRLVFGSVTDKVVRAATSPILIFHPNPA